MAKVFGLQGTNNKAVVTEREGVSTLTSYFTDVARLDLITNKLEVNGYYSATTMVHLNAFFDFYGFKKMNKQELIREFNLTTNI
jgi:hypothetical protein